MELHSCSSFSSMNDHYLYSGNKTHFLQKVEVFRFVLPRDIFFFLGFPIPSIWEPENLFLNFMINSSGNKPFDHNVFLATYVT